jgi:hypothetical protein
LEIHSWSKIKITPPFCHKGTKGKQSNKTTSRNKITPPNGLRRTRETD